MRRALAVVILLGIAGAGALYYTGVAREREYRRLIATGDQTLATDELFRAIEAYSGAIALKRASMAGYLKRGEAYRLRGELPEALRDLSTASHLDPAATRPLEQLGDVAYALEHYENAAQYYTRYVQLDDQNPRVLYKLAVASERNGRIARAIRALRQAISIDPSFAEAHYLLGIYLREQDRHEESRAALADAVALSPGFLEAREALADIHRALGETRQELQQLDALAALDQDRPERHVTRALAYARYGQTELAVLALGRAAEYHPDQPQVYAALGRVWLDIALARNDRISLSKAVEALQSVPASTASSETLTLLAQALESDGDGDGARRTLRQAIERFPVDPAAFLRLARLEERDSNWDEARRLRASYATLAGASPPTPADPARVVG
jgi:tetratricopeptide (TPR) repeat protein